MVNILSERYDCAIIGSGPAGLSAAVNLKIRNKSLIVFGSKNLSDKLEKAPEINNYLGFPGISGKEMKERFLAHIENMGISITNEKINAIYAMGDYFSLMVNEKMYEAKTIIIATGMVVSQSIKGEDTFLGKGVSYCATCDAPLYRGKTVAIVGYNREAEDEAAYVGELAAKVLYIPMYRDAAALRDNIEIVEGKPVEIAGDNSASQLKLKEKELDVDGIFILKDSVPPSQLVPGLEMENGHIRVDRNMKTNIDGCYAAGDCTGKPYQYMKSAGEGQVAALNAVLYIETK